MKLWARLRRLFGYPEVPNHDYVESGLRFPELDLGRMRKRLALVEQGKTRGVRDEPAFDHATFDDVENSVVTTIQAEARHAYGTLVDNLRAYDDRLSALKIETRLVQLVSVAESARADFPARIRDGRDLLYQMSRHAVAMNDELERFRRENRLERPPRFPPSKLWHFGFALLLIFIESPLNGSLLARGDPLGLLGGITQALVIAVINVSSGLVAGRVAVPNTFHERWWRRVGGTGGLVIFAAFVLTFNLVVAHYRAALGGENPSQAERDALVQFLAKPFGIPDVAGWLLFILGVGFAVLAAVDGWKADDPYPGYGVLARQKQEALDDYAAQKAELTAELEQVRNDAVERMDRLTAEVEVRQGQHDALLQSRSRLRHQFRQHLAYLEQSANELLSAYRQANRAERTTPEPPRFSERWLLPTDAYGGQAPAAPADGDKLGDRLAEVFAQVRAARQQVEADYRSAIHEYETIDELIPEDIRGPLRHRRA